MIRTKKEVQNYINEWKKENQDRITVMVEKGKKDYYREQAKKEGKSLTRFIIDCIESHIEQANKNATITEENNSKGIMYHNREK